MRVSHIYTCLVFGCLDEDENVLLCIVWYTYCSLVFNNGEMSQHNENSTRLCRFSE